MTNSRFTTQAPSGTTVFLVGMHINTPWALHRIMPVMLAMPRMLIEQMKNRDIGMIGTPRTFVSGRIVMVVQYWKSYEALEAYAKAGELDHLPAWRAFNKAARKSNAVGVFHETYVLDNGNHEAIYSNLPKAILLGAAVGQVAIGKQTESSRERLIGRD